MDHEFDKEVLQGGLLAAGIALFLSFKLPKWLAAAFGWQEAYQLACAWVAGQGIWIKAALVFGYVLASFFVLVVIAAAIWTAGNLLVKGICIAAVRLAEAVSRLVSGAARGMGTIVAFVARCAASPFIFLVDMFWRAVNGCVLYIRAVLEERKELRRLYREEYANDFRSFREFKRYVRAGGSEGGPRSSGERREEGSKRKEASGTDSYRQAVRLFGLGQGFDEAGLDSRFRELMKRVHPDVAGPNDLAAKLNLARDLIKERRGWA